MHGGGSVHMQAVAGWDDKPGVIGHDDDDVECSSPVTDCRGVLTCGEDRCSSDVIEYRFRWLVLGNTGEDGAVSWIGVALHQAMG